MLFVSGTSSEWKVRMYVNAEREREAEMNPTNHREERERKGGQSYHERAEFSEREGEVHRIKRKRAVFLLQHGTVEINRTDERRTHVQTPLCRVTRQPKLCETSHGDSRGHIGCADPNRRSTTVGSNVEGRWEGGTKRERGTRGHSSFFLLTPASSTVFNTTGERKSDEETHIT